MQHVCNKAKQNAVIAMDCTYQSVNKSSQRDKLKGISKRWKPCYYWVFEVMEVAEKLGFYIHLQQPIKKDNFLEVHPEQGKHLFFRLLR